LAELQAFDHGMVIWILNTSAGRAGVYHRGDHSATNTPKTTRLEQQPSQESREL
jgi:hypothetical protein